MDFISEYFYLLVFIAVIAFNVIKTLKKQEKQDNDRSFAPGNTFEFDAEEYEEEVVVQQKPKNVVMNNNVVQSRENINITKKKPDSNKSKLSKKSSKSGINAEIDVCFDSVESARRAFIYSEIWNRKY